MTLTVELVSFVVFCKTVLSLDNYRCKKWIESREHHQNVCRFLLDCRLIYKRQNFNPMLSSDHGKVSPKDSLPCWMTRNEFLLRLLYRLVLVSLVRNLQLGVTCLSLWGSNKMLLALDFEQNALCRLNTNKTGVNSIVVFLLFLYFYQVPFVMFFSWCSLKYTLRKIVKLYQKCTSVSNRGKAGKEEGSEKILLMAVSLKMGTVVEVKKVARGIQMGDIWLRMPQYLFWFQKKKVIQHHLRFLFENVYIFKLTLTISEFESDDEWAFFPGKQPVSKLLQLERDPGARDTTHQTPSPWTRQLSRPTQPQPRQHRHHGTRWEPTLTHYLA